MIEHRGIRTLRGFQGDPSWIDTKGRTIGEIDRANEFAALTRGNKAPASQPETEARLPDVALSRGFSPPGPAAVRDGRADFFAFSDMGVER